MKIKVLVIIMLFFAVNVAQAKVYLIVNSATDEIYSLSNEDDAVMPTSGYKKVILDYDMKEIELQAKATDYKYKDNKFVLNIQKISDQEIAKESAQEKAEELKDIQNKAYYLALDALIKGGKTFKHYQLSDFEGGQ